MTRQRHGDTIFGFFLMFAALFVTLPQYIYVVGGVNVVNFAVLCFFLAFIFVERKIAKLNLFENIGWFWFYMFVYAIQYLMTGGSVKFVSFTLSYIVVPYIAVSLIDSEIRLIKTIDALIFGGAVLGILGIIESVLGYNFIQPFANADAAFFHEVRYGLLRIMTTFGQPIAYGIFQVFIIALVNYRLGMSTGKRKYLYLVYFIAVVNVFLSVSRLPIIMLIIVQLLISMKKTGKSFAAYITVFVVLGSAVIAIVSSLDFEMPFLDDMLETIFSLFGNGEVSEAGTVVGVGNRLELWSWVTESMKGHWLFGHGMSAQFTYEVYEWQIKTSIENQYLNILYYNGIIGLITLILSYFGSLLYIRKGIINYKALSEEGALNLNEVLLILLGTYYIVELGIQESDFTRMYVIIIAVLISYNRILRRNSIMAEGINE